MRGGRVLLDEAENAAFDAAMREWQGRLNLMDWRVERGRSAPVASMAEVSLDYGARLAEYRTGNWGGTPKTSHSIRETALHECLHILLCELQHVVKRGCDADMIESVEHRVVTTLEKILIGINA